MRQVRRTGTFHGWSLAEGFVVQHDLVFHAHVRHRHDGWWSGGLLAIFQRLRVIFYGRNPTTLWLGEALGSQGT